MSQSKTKNLAGGTLVPCPTVHRIGLQPSRGATLRSNRPLLLLTGQSPGRERTHRASKAVWVRLNLYKQE